MSEKSRTAEQLRELFRATFRVDPPQADVDLLDSGVLDSLQLAELLVQLELHFGTHIRIEAIELDDLRTIDRIAGLVCAATATADLARDAGATA